jgi:small conductance mechanosensitive channel
MQELIDTFTNYFQKNWQDFVDKLPEIILALVIFFIFWLVARISRSVALGVVGRLKDKDHEKMELTIVFGRIIRIGILILGVVIALSIAGVNLTALIASLGMLGFALSFALQDYIKNFISGIIILSQRPFVIGDQIEFGKNSGKVKSIEIRFTVLTTYDNREAVISNADMLSKAVIINTAHSKRQSQLNIEFILKSGVRDLVAEISKTIKETDGVIEKPEPKNLYDGFESNKIKMSFYYWTKSSIEHEKSTKSLVIDNTYRLLRERELEELKIM